MDISYTEKQGCNAGPSPLLSKPRLEEHPCHCGKRVDHSDTVGSTRSCQQLKPLPSGLVPLGDTLNEEFTDKQTLSPHDQGGDVRTAGHDFGLDEDGPDNINDTSSLVAKERACRNTPPAYGSIEYLGFDPLSSTPNRKGKIRPNFRVRFAHAHTVRRYEREAKSVSYRNHGWIRDLCEEGIEPNPGPKCVHVARGEVPVCHTVMYCLYENHLHRKQPALKATGADRRRIEKLGQSGAQQKKKQMETSIPCDSGDPNECFRKSGRPHGHCKESACNHPSEKLRKKYYPTPDEISQQKEEDYLASISGLPSMDPDDYPVLSDQKNNNRKCDKKGKTKAPVENEMVAQPVPIEIPIDYPIVDTDTCPSDASTSKGLVPSTLLVGKKCVDEYVKPSTLLRGVRATPTRVQQTDCENDTCHTLRPLQATTSRSVPSIENVSSTHHHANSRTTTDQPKIEPGHNDRALHSDCENDTTHTPRPSRATTVRIEPPGGLKDASPIPVIDPLEDEAPDSSDDEEMPVIKKEPVLELKFEYLYYCEKRTPITLYNTIIGMFNNVKNRVFSTNTSILGIHQLTERTAVARTTTNTASLFLFGLDDLLPTNETSTDEFAERYPYRTEFPVPYYPQLLSHLMHKTVSVRTVDKGHNIREDSLARAGQISVLFLENGNYPYDYDIMFNTLLVWHNKKTADFFRAKRVHGTGGQMSFV